MPVERIACPSCGASLEITDSTTVVTCKFCGSTLHINFGPVPQQRDWREPDGTVRDVSSGYGLFKATWPEGWQLAGTSLKGVGGSRRYIPGVKLADNAGGSITVTVGDAGTRQSVAMQQMKATHGGHLRGVDQTTYAEMPDPIQLADSLAIQCSRQHGGGDLTLVGQARRDDLQRNQQKLLDDVHNGPDSPDKYGIPISDPFVAEVLRIYSFEASGQTWECATFVYLAAVKVNYEQAYPTIGMGGLLGGLGMGGLGNLFGLGGGAQRQAQPQYQGAGVGTGDGVGIWRTHDQTAYASAGTINWSVDRLCSLTYPAEQFDDKLRGDFVPIIDSMRMHDDVQRLIYQEVQQINAAVNQAGSVAMAQQQATFQAGQAIHRQQQAAAQAQFDSWQARSNAQHQAFRERSNAMFNNGSYGGGSGSHAPDYSEAIRGVNTYTTSDGREVEVSIHADHVWENKAGDVIGTSGTTSPGADWTELNRH